MENVYTNLKQLLAAHPRLGLAISGGGDSIALLHLLLECKPQPNQLTLLHCNHHWSPWGNEAEAFVTNLAAQHHLPLITAHGTGKPEEGNAEAHARAARHQFFAEAAQTHNLNAIFVAHTQADQAEGFLIRLARGSGLTGLSGMNEASTIHSTRILRPLLNTSREALRTYLQKNQHTWLEDPANTEDNYLRARLRKLLPQLAEAGLDATSITASIASLNRAETTLQTFTQTAWQTIATEEQGTLTLNRAALLNQPEEIAQRLIARAITRLTSVSMPPRLSKRLSLLETFQSDTGTATLGGLIWKWNKDSIKATCEKPLFLAP